MFRFIVLLASLLFAPASASAGAASPEDMKCLYEQADALYYAYQGDWFEALVRLDAVPARSRNLDKSKFDALFADTDRVAGAFELNYRMDQRAGRAIKKVIEGKVEDTVRNEAIFRLSRIYFQKNQPEQALRAIKLIRGNVPATIRPDLELLRANIALANGRTAEAITILKDLQDEPGPDGFSSYNLGIALMRNGSEQEARQYLDRAGRISGDDPATLAIRDKANLVLGEKLLSENYFDMAKEILDRVRISGPFSNRALLSSGWADASRERFENALVPWSALADRGVTDPAVQEAMLAVPYAYSKLGVYSTAAVKYEAALKTFDTEIGRLGASIQSIREGNFLKALASEKLKQDADWINKLRDLPESPETRYLLDLMASHDFHESLKNYLDLEQLRRKLEAWSGDLVAFEDIIRQRWAQYQPLLPVIDREFRSLEARIRIRLMQRDRIAQKLKAMPVVPGNVLLVTAEEQKMSKWLAPFEKRVTPYSDEVALRFGERIRRLRGVLSWNITTQHDQRVAVANKYLADAGNHLDELNREIELMQRRRAAFVRTRQDAIESHQGYVDVIKRQRQRITAAREKVQSLMATQGQVLETMAMNELSKRRERLAEFQVKARFAMADSYDRASKAQPQKRDAL